MQTKELMALIGRIAKSVSKMVSDVQQAAVECVLHAVEHGNVTPATQLVSALGKGMRASALIVWFEQTGVFAMGPEGAFTLDKDGRKAAQKEDPAGMRERLADIPWEGAKKAKPTITEIDLAVELDRFFDKMSKRIAGDGTVKVTNMEVYSAALRAAELCHARKVIAEQNALDADEIERVYGIKPTITEGQKALMHLTTQNAQ